MKNPNEIEKYIKHAKKASPVKAYVKGDLSAAAVPMLDITEVEAHIAPSCTMRNRIAIGKNAVIMMGATVTGSPAKIIKMQDEKTEDKTQLLDEPDKIISIVPRTTLKMGSPFLIQLIRAPPKCCDLKNVIKL